MTESITCRHFFDGHHLLGPHRIIFNDGVIEVIEPFSGEPDHYLVGPGLVDIQMNGFESVDVARATSDELQQLGERLAALGTTSWLATITTAPLDVLSQSIEKISAAIDNDSAVGCAGLHIEGPFLGNAPGAHRPDWIIPFDSDWVSQLPSSVRLMTIASEQPNVASAVRALREKHIAVSIGHSRPTDGQWNDARGAGASLVTHLFNGMSGVHHRDNGLALQALTDDEVYAGIIGDMIHVSPQAVNLAFRAKGGARMCLVSDSVGWQTSWAQKRNIQVSDGAPRLPDGTLAGSSTSLAECLRRVVHEAKVSLVEALRSATSSPSAAIGANNAGHVTLGEEADLVAFDDSLHVVSTWRRLVSLRG